MFDIMRAEISGGEHMENIVNRQIEMISVCAADGALTPIRFRMEDGEHMLRTVPIRQVVCSRPISYAGVEAIQYLCKTQLGQQEALLELRYTVRTHRWTLFRAVPEAHVRRAEERRACHHAPADREGGSPAGRGKVREDLSGRVDAARFVAPRHAARATRDTAVYGHGTQFTALRSFGES